MQDDQRRPYHYDRRLRSYSSSAYAYGVQSGPRTPLTARISGVGGNYAEAMGGFHPVANMPMAAPTTAVRVTADRVQVEDLVPLYAGVTASPIPAQRPGRWFQLFAAGQP